MYKNSCLYVFGLNHISSEIKFRYYIHFKYNLTNQVNSRWLINLIILVILIERVSSPEDASNLIHLLIVNYYLLCKRLLLINLSLKIP